MPDVVTQPQAQPADATRPAAPDPAAPPVYILVVDDNEANRDVLARRLKRRGYSPVMAEDGPAALALLESQTFDLVLLDVMMPGMSGLEVLERIRKTTPATVLPVIMATAKDQSEDVVHALNLGASDYVTKPLDFSILMARVQTQLLLGQSIRQVVELQQRIGQRNAELERVNAELSSANARINSDLLAAAQIQASYLPTVLPAVPGFEFAWSYEACDHLAGDFLNVCPIDAEHVGLYLLDVSGHGVAAALLAVAAARALAPAPDPDSILIRAATATEAAGPVPPAEVADRLNQKFAWDANPGQFLTFFYVLLDVPSRHLTYVSAGHPSAIIVSATRPPQLLDESGLPIGIGEKYDEHAITLQRGDRLYLYSDGVPETMTPGLELFGETRLVDALTRGLAQPLGASLETLKDELRQWRGDSPTRDDVSILALECR